MKKKAQRHGQVAKARYHDKRTYSPAKYGIARNGTKYMYSLGFVDGLYNVNRRSDVKRNFGTKKANSYTLGNAAGKKSSRSYYKKTKSSLAKKL